MNVGTFLDIATQKDVVYRATVLAIIVGTILIAINHGQCIISGHFNINCFISCALTMMVPYCVSTISSVLATKEPKQP